MAVSAERLSHLLLDLELIKPDDVQAAWQELGRRDVPAQEFLQFFIRRNLLTNWQRERLLRGERRGFFFGPYKVLYLVGAGTFARVYRAVHKKTGQIVALKVLRSRYSEDPLKTEQFLREGRMGLNLRHPNIVPILGVDKHRGRFWIVMEFVEGQNLRDLVKIRRRLSPGDSTRLMVDVTNAIRYAHQKGIMHRDLKPSNVLVSSRGVAKVVDFGLASELDQEEGKNLRTVDYAGLEKASGAKRNDPRSDIYFLGTIYYYMLSGKHALKETRDRGERISKQRFLNVVPIQHVVPGLPPGVVAICNRALELNPERRYQTPSEMLVELKGVLPRLEATQVPAAAGADTNGSAPPLSGERSSKRTVMFVEANPEMQDAIRKGFKSVGYRVLITVDPDRAMDRFQDDHEVADVVVFDAETVGEKALQGFNRFYEEDVTRGVPCLLLLGKEQQEWAKHAQLAHHRVALQLPLTVKQLRVAVSQLIARRSQPV